MEVSQAAERLDQICKYSHKILKKYVVNGMITLQDGPQLHNLVEARDYRIICILEVYSQNKNEDDFLENLGLLTQVLKDQGELEDKENSERGSYSAGDDEVPGADVQEDAVQNDSFTLKIEEATGKGFLNLDAAKWSID